MHRRELDNGPTVNVIPEAAPFVEDVSETKEASNSESEIDITATVISACIMVWQWLVFILWSDRGWYLYYGLTLVPSYALCRILFMYGLTLVPNNHLARLNIN